MQIGGNSLRNLEVFQNLTDGRENGSLFWVLNHTATKFGSRTFRSWVASPLMDVRYSGIDKIICNSLIIGPKTSKINSALN